MRKSLVFGCVLAFCSNNLKYKEKFCIRVCFVFFYFFLFQPFEKEGGILYSGVF